MVTEALDGKKEWGLVGGPPCQAYSIVGRSRNRGIDAKDIKVRLYKEYLRLVARFRPTVFVMENVKGLLSATLEESIFSQILSDLKEPGKATGIAECPGYRIHSFVEKESECDADGNPNHEQWIFSFEARTTAVPKPATE